MNSRANNESEKDVHETSENICARNERFIQELSSPEIYVEPTSSDIESVQRGLDFILRLALDDENFHNFGSDAFSCFYDIATTAEEPLRKFALLRTELTAQLWLKHYPTLRNESEEEDEDPDKLLDFMMGLYSLERVGIGHGSKEELRVACSKCSLVDLFGIEKDDIMVRSLPVSEPAIAHSDYISCISSAFYAAKTGINVHLDLKNLLKLLPTFRPYSDFHDVRDGHDDDNFDEYADTLTLIANVVHVLSSYGEFCISPTLLPQEYAYLVNPVHLERAMETVDVHLAGEICHCLRVFGTSEHHPLLAKGLQFLRNSQRKDGSWPTRRQDEGAYVRYHATMCAISALNPQRFRGFGPSDPTIVEDLMIYRYSTRHGMQAAMKKMDEKLISSSFLAVELPPLSSVTHLRDYYEAKANSSRGEIDIPTQIYGLHRLHSLMTEKKIFADSTKRRLRRKYSSNASAGNRTSKALKKSNIPEDD